MTHYTLIVYMHYVLNHVVYELYTIFCHSTLESYISSLSIKAATVVRHQHTTFFFLSASSRYLKCTFLFGIFNVNTKFALFILQNGRIVHKYVNWDAP